MVSVGVGEIASVGVDVGVSNVINKGSVYFFYPLVNFMGLKIPTNSTWTLACRGLCIQTPICILIIDLILSCISAYFLSNFFILQLS